MASQSTLLACEALDYKQMCSRHGRAVQYTGVGTAGESQHTLHFQNRLLVSLCFQSGCGISITSFLARILGFSKRFLGFERPPKGGQYLNPAVSATTLVSYSPETTQILTEVIENSYIYRLKASQTGDCFKTSGIAARCLLTQSNFVRPFHRGMVPHVIGHN